MGGQINSQVENWSEELDMTLGRKRDKLWKNGHGDIDLQYEFLSHNGLERWSYLSPNSMKGSHCSKEKTMEPSSANLLPYWRSSSLANICPVSSCPKGRRISLSSTVEWFFPPDKLILPPRNAKVSFYENVSTLGQIPFTSNLQRTPQTHYLLLPLLSLFSSGSFLLGVLQPMRLQRVEYNLATTQQQQGWFILLFRGSKINFVKQLYFNKNLF